MYRLSLTVILLLSFAFFGGPKRSKDYDLKDYFDFYNRVYFHDNLPHDTIAEWGEPEDGKEYLIGLTEGTKERHPYRIIVSRFYNPSIQESRETLLHEMCHIYTEENGDLDFNPHGEAWQECMLNLANNYHAFEYLW